MPWPNWLRRLLGGGGWSPPPPPAPPGPAQPGGIAAPGLVVRQNAERRGRGLAELESNASLTNLAVSWAASMARAGRLEHGDSYGRIGPHFPGMAVAENVAWGQETPDQVVEAWLDSPGHRQNLLGPYTLVGCGRERPRRPDVLVQHVRRVTGHPLPESFPMAKKKSPPPRDDDAEDEIAELREQIDSGELAEPEKAEAIARLAELRREVAGRPDPADDE